MVVRRPWSGNALYLLCDVMPTPTITACRADLALLRKQLVTLALAVLMVAQRAFHLGLIDIRGVGYAVRLSERIRLAGRTIVRRTRRSR